MQDVDDSITACIGTVHDKFNPIGLLDEVSSCKEQHDWITVHSKDVALFWAGASGVPNPQLQLGHYNYSKIEDTITLDANNNLGAYSFPTGEQFAIWHTYVGEFRQQCGTPPAAKCQLTWHEQCIGAPNGHPEIGVDFSQSGNSFDMQWTETINGAWGALQPLNGVGPCATASTAFGNTIQWESKSSTKWNLLC